MTGKTSVWTAVRDQYLLPGLSRVGFPGFVESRSFSKKKKGFGFGTGKDLQGALQRNNVSMSAKHEGRLAEIREEAYKHLAVGHLNDFMALNGPIFKS